MEPAVFLAVLFAAALHAGWNAVVKIGLDRFLSVTLISLAAAVVSALLLPFVPVPIADAWPWLLVSCLLHTGYKLFLIEAYQAGDLGQVYPIARGAAPLIVSVVMTVGFSEHLSPPATAGVALLVAGVWLMSAMGGRERAKLELRAVLYALATSVFIASYTLADGLGARINGDAHGYAVWLFFLDGLLMLAILTAKRGVRSVTALLAHWRSGLAGGAMSFGSYWIAIWAMTSAPIALVAALRESSVLFAAAISILLLREPMSRWRAAAAVIIVIGIILTRAN